MVERGVAADVAPPDHDHWWASVEGQYLLFDGDKAKYDGDFNVDDDLDTFKLKPDDGWGIGGEVGFRPADSLWSFLARVRYGESNKKKDHHDNLYSSFDGDVFGGTAKADHKENYFIGDLEIGRDVGLGMFGDGSNLRLFAGVRFAHFKANGHLHTQSNYSSFYSSSGHADVSFKREFNGVGPRIGFDSTVPFGDMFALDLGAAGALLYGKQKFKAQGSATYSGYGPYHFDNQRSKMTWVPNLEASAALSWLITENAKFSLGYRVDAYFDVYDDGGMDSRDEGDRIIHGPFVKLTIGNN
jgi:hypothetical protein